MPTFWPHLRAVTRGHRPVLLLGLLLPWVVFGTVAKVVLETGGFPGDKPILMFLHSHATPGLNALALGLTVVGNTWPMILAGVVITLRLAVRGHRRQAWIFALSVGGSMLLTQVIKALAMRPRPALWMSIRPEHTYSFPSGHAMDTAALATAVGFLLWRYRAAWLAQAAGPLFVLGVGWARMYLGVHYPSDVLAGWSSAVGWVMLVQGLASPGFRALWQPWPTAVPD